MRLVHRAFCFAVLLLVAATGARAEDNLKTTAAKTGVLTHMMEATRLAGLDDPEVDVGPLTLFAPSDTAFEALPADLRARLLAPENRDILTSLLLHHAVPGEFPTERLLKASARHYAVDAIDGSEVEITTRRGIDVEGARIVQGDIRATDGIIHVIDKVLIPRSVMTALMAPASPAGTEMASPGF
jgi:uncharacterized surface protein with fasciclin (FAS1) repeats